MTDFKIGDKVRFTEDYGSSVLNGDTGEVFYAYELHDGEQMVDIRLDNPRARFPVVGVYGFRIEHVKDEPAPHRKTRFIDEARNWLDNAGIDYNVSDVLALADYLSRQA